MSKLPDPGALNQRAESRRATTSTFRPVKQYVTYLCASPTGSGCDAASESASVAFRRDMARLSAGGLAALAAVLLVFGAVVERAQARRVPAEAGPAWPADASAPLDPVARLQQRLSAGEPVLTRDSVLGYLPSLLRALDIPVSSQGFVFSRTSLQTDKITPWTPRALYFNDDVYIGYVQESHFIEIAAMHPTKGAVFYTLGQTAREQPAFERETRTCLMCHQSRATTGGVPGLMVLSTITDRHGYPITGVHDGGMTDATPIRQRWGGWYVTGTHGTLPDADTTGRAASAAGHAGNVYSELFRHEVPDKERYRTQIDLTTQSARTSLADRFDVSPYPSAHSDIVALMVLVHQVAVHNLLTAVHEIAATTVTVPDDLASATAEQVRLSGAVDRLLRAMLFVREAPLAGSMRGTTSFATEFAQRGPRDDRGRSLRDFDLNTRLFRHPFSFLVYSESFDALPEPTRALLYRRLLAVLAGADATPDFAHLAAADRSAILEILVGTRPEFARAWQRQHVRE